MMPCNIPARPLTDAERDLAEQNLALAHMLTLRFLRSRPWLDGEPFTEAALFALLRAAQKFDPAPGGSSGRWPASTSSVPSSPNRDGNTGARAAPTAWPAGRRSPGARPAVRFALPEDEAAVPQGDRGRFHPQGKGTAHRG